MIFSENPHPVFRIMLEGSRFERVLHEYRVFPFGTGREQSHRTVHQFLDSAYLFYRLRRQFGPRTSARRLTFPPFYGLVNRLDPCLRAGAGGKVLDFTAVETVADAHLDLVEAVQNIELGERQPIDSAGTRGLAAQPRIEPAAATWPPGHRAEFAPSLAKAASNLVVLFGGERPLAHPRRVGLADAEHIIDRAGPHPAAGRGLPRHRVRRGHERIGAVVDIEQRALRALEKDALAFAALGIEQCPDR